MRATMALADTPCSTRVTAIALNTTDSCGVGMRLVISRNAISPRLSLPRMSRARSNPCTVILSGSIRAMSDFKVLRLAMVQLLLGLFAFFSDRKRSLAMDTHHCLFSPNQSHIKFYQLHGFAAPYPRAKSCRIFSPGRIVENVNGEQMKIASSDGTSQSRQFAEFFAALTERELPDQIFERALDSLIDSVGCGLFGATQPWSTALRCMV